MVGFIDRLLLRIAHHLLFRIAHSRAALGLPGDGEAAAGGPEAAG
jgi:hypothetical protein